MPPQQSQRNLQDTLLAAIDELIAAYESAVAAEPGARDQSAEEPSARPGPRPAEDVSPTEITISAGPFGTVAEVRDFERALAEIPSVRDVHVRGYEGTNRAIIEVSLGASVTDRLESTGGGPAGPGDSVT